ncbi:VCBS repeat-containing protein [Streptomyces sp. NBC_00683]|uniref:FG-GAP repeat domain-containing protein n=1 Tax=Streptomyces sp. NBC_00683 TaxID=2903670 RepID=UPI002E310C11|nr:VCBS repeat-containing protein [Streptomyces sp. NBC_00683]
MAHRALSSGVIAASLVLSVTAGLPTPAAATPRAVQNAVPAATAAAADPVVVPATLRSTVQSFNLVSTGGAREADAVGELGVFNRPSANSGYRWTRFSDGAHVPAGPTGSGILMKVYGTGTDTIAYQWADEVELRDMVAGTTTFVPIPEGLTFAGVYGHTVVAVKLVTTEADGTTSTTATEAHLLDIRADGTTRDRTVTGLPEGARYAGAAQTAATGDESGVLLRYVHDGVAKMAMVDFGTAHMAGSSARIQGTAPGYLLTPRYVVWYSYGADSTISVVPRSDIGATPRVLTAPAPTERSGYHLAVVGDWLLHNKGSVSLMATPLDGGPSRQLLAKARTEIAAAQDGSAVVVGGATGYASDTTWGVYRIVEGQDGVPEPTRVIDLAALPMDLEGIGLSAGRLTAVTRPTTLRNGTERELAVQGTPSYGPASGSSISFVSECGPEDPDCHAIHGTGDGKPVVLIRLESGAGDEIRERGSSVRTGLSGGTLTDTDGDYAVYTHAASNQQIVYRLGGQKILTRSPVASALWAGTLWSAGTKPGTVTSYDLATGSTTATVDLGSGCAPSELQALGRWLYWTCGPSGGAGILDRTTGKSIAVPVGEALLGDGYLVRHDKAAGKLVLTDLVSSAATGAAVTRVVADLPATANPQRRVAWTVDKYGGHLAYVDAGQQVHVVPTGVATQPLSARDESWTGQPGADSSVWRYGGKLSKPASSWKAVFTNRRTGKAVGTVTGGEVRGRLTGYWDGRTGADPLAVNGPYSWTLTVQPADGHGAAMVRSGEFVLTGGAAAWRDSGRDGLGDLHVVVDEGMIGHRDGKLPGTVGPPTGHWGIFDTDARRILPTGDLAGDGCNDYLAVKTDGTLLRIDSWCGIGVNAEPVQIGVGWKTYDMFAPGDINGDGIPDLLARQQSTGYLFLYPGDGKGRLKARTQIGVGWKGLTVVGAGDLTGDGFGDLLVRDSAGVLWRYAGTGTGRVAAKVRIGPGWQAYNALAAVGDITGDGRNDLLARDKAGVLWRYNGTGTGSFTARAKVGPGWNIYPTIF